MDDVDDVDDVIGAYSARAVEYADLLGTMDVIDERDRAEVFGWAEQQRGRLVDLGCGPGHWTASLAAAGHDVVGVEPSKAFRDLAGLRFPGTPVMEGRADRMPFEDGSVGAVLAWYSLIHLDAAQLRAALTEVARVVPIGGGFLVGLFEGPVSESFEHTVVQAYRWPVEQFVVPLEAAGFAVTGIALRTVPPHRPHATIMAVRASTRG